MSLQAQLITDLAHGFITAEQTRSPIEPIGSLHPELTEADVYHVQMAIVEHKLQRGDQIIGKKSGATNQPAQNLFGLSEPFYGHLLASGRVADGGTIAVSELIHPRLECEITFRMGRPLVGPNVTVADVLDATEAVIASFEIVDTRTRDWKLLGMRELIADNGLVARCVLGSQQVPVAGLDLPNVTVVLQKNGQKIAESSGTAVLGDPAISVAWLANKLATHKRGLAAGELVQAGSLTPLQPISAGDRFEATFVGIGSVSVQFV